MVRIKRGNIARKRRKKILNFASGYRAAHSTIFRIANQQVIHAFRYSYIDRKKKKRIFRKIWIRRINAAARLNSTSYNNLIHKLKNQKIDLNKKMLSQIAVCDYHAFKRLINAK